MIDLRRAIAPESARNPRLRARRLLDLTGRSGVYAIIHRKTREARRAAP